MPDRLDSMDDLAARNLELALQALAAGEYGEPYGAASPRENSRSEFSGDREAVASSISMRSSFGDTALDKGTP